VHLLVILNYDFRTIKSTYLSLVKDSSSACLVAILTCMPKRSFPLMIVC
jgi:hypothetical protein